MVGCCIFAVAKYGKNDMQLSFFCPNFAEKDGNGINSERNRVFSVHFDSKNESILLF